jgi:hypothetical protein
LPWGQSSRSTPGFGVKPFTATPSRVAHPAGMIRRFSPAAFLALLFTTATLAAPADALVVCQRDNRPGRFKIRAVCKPGTETAVLSLATPEQPDAPVGGPGTIESAVVTPGVPATDEPPVGQPGPVAGGAPITRIFSAHEGGGTLIEGYGDEWVEFGFPRTYDDTPPPGIVAQPLGAVPSFTFRTEGTSDIAITFTAQCRVNSASPSGRSLRVRFELDGLSLHPHENEPNLCESRTPASNLAVSVTYAVEDVPEGQHQIRALAHLAGFDGEDATLFGKDLVVIVSERP